MTKSDVEYDSNNSGGRWWLTDENWLDLEKAGWKIVWGRLEYLYSDKGEYIRDDDGTPKLVEAGDGNGTGIVHLRSLKKEDGRWLGSLARTAFKIGATSVREAAAEWEKITGQSATDAGCACCGQPHRFTLYVDGRYVDSGPNTEFVASWN